MPATSRLLPRSGPRHRGRRPRAARGPRSGALRLRRGRLLRRRRHRARGRTLAPRRPGRRRARRLRHGELGRRAGARQLWGPYFLWRLLVDARHQRQGHRPRRRRASSPTRCVPTAARAAHELRPGRGLAAALLRGAGLRADRRGRLPRRGPPGASTSAGRRRRDERAAPSSASTPAPSPRRPPATPRSSWSRPPTATTASTRATSTARWRPGRSATPSRAPGRWAGPGSTAPCRTRSRSSTTSTALAESAEVIGAVNTVVATDGDLVGHNTDGQGFVESLRTVVDPAGLEVVVLGAGGAARAVAVETALAGAAPITVVNRDAAPRRGAGPGRHRRAPACPRPSSPGTGRMPCPPRTDVVVHATSVGLRRRRRDGRRRPRQPARGPRGRRRRRLATAHRPPARRRGARRRDPRRPRACSSARAPSRCGTGPVSSPTGRSCGPPRPPRCGI